MFPILLRAVMGLVATCAALHLRVTAKAEPTESADSQRWAVVIVGLPGDDEHAALFDETASTWSRWLAETRRIPAERLIVCSGPARDDVSGNQRPATRESLAKTCEELAGKLRERDSLWVLVLGHGHYDGRRAWLHVPGADPDSGDLAKWLNAIRAREQTLWLTQAASGWWVKPLARAGRVVIAATEADREENETEFPHALATVMRAPPESLDANRDRHVSLAELFRAAAREANARFERDKRVATEHAQLDDNADGLGTELERLFDENAPAPDAANPTAKPAAKPDRPQDGRAAAHINLFELTAEPPP